MTSNEKTVSPESKALQAIQEEAVKLLGKNPSPEIRDGLLLIESIARYGLDVRTDAEKTSD